MAAAPRVSICIAAYNAADYLGAAISSALTQTYGEIEVVIVDDGSTDDTARVAAAYGGRIRFTSQANGGCAAGRNTALSLASGDYIAISDADDILLPNHVQSCMDLLLSSPPKTWVCAEALLLTDRGIGGPVLPFGQIPTDRQRAAILQANIATGYSVYPRTMIDEVGDYAPELRFAEDWDLWARAIFSGWRVRASTTPTALYRQVSGSNSRQEQAMIDAEEMVFRRLSTSHGNVMTEDERGHVQRRLTRGSARDLARKSDRALDTGDWRAAARYASLASSDYPLDARLKWKARMLTAAPSAGRLIAFQRRRRAESL